MRWMNSYLLSVVNSVAQHHSVTDVHYSVTMLITVSHMSITVSRMSISVADPRWCRIEITPNRTEWNPSYTLLFNNISEHLTIMFYDVLLLDNILCLHEPIHLRRRRLETLISRKTGQAEIGEGIQIDLRRSSGISRLHDEMTSAITKG